MIKWLVNKIKIEILETIKHDIKNNIDKLIDSENRYCNSCYNEIDSRLNYIKSEEFIDSIIERIKRKQL